MNILDRAGSSIAVRRRAAMEAPAPSVRQRRRATVASLAPLVILIAAVGFVIPSYLFGLDASDPVLGGAFTLALLLALAYWRHATRLGRWTRPFLAMGAMILVYLALTVYHGTYAGGLKAAAQVTLAFSCFTVGLISGEAMERSKGGAASFFIALVICYMMLVTLAVLVPPTEDIHKNAIGGAAAYIAIMIAAIRYANSGKFLGLLLPVPMIALAAFVSDHRVMLGIAFVTPVAMIGMWIFRFRLTQRCLIFLSAAVSALTFYMYVEYKWIASFTSWNWAVVDLTGRSITSGRQLIWGPIYNAVEGHLWFGDGFAVHAADFTDLLLSPHNAFLMIAMQTGLAGLLPFVFIIFSLSRAATRGPFSLSKAFFAMTLSIAIIHNTFETAFLQVNFSIASLIWLSLGIVGAQIPRLSSGRVSRPVSPSVSAHPGPPSRGLGPLLNRVPPQGTRL